MISFKNVLYRHCVNIYIYIYLFIYTSILICPAVLNRNPGCDMFKGRICRKLEEMNENTTQICHEGPTPQISSCGYTWRIIPVNATYH